MKPEPRAATDVAAADFGVSGIASSCCRHFFRVISMDISRSEQRVLHLLAQGGQIEIEKQNKRATAVICRTRDGWRYPGVDLELFRKLKRKKAVSSSDGGPYRITRRGLELVRSQLDNR